MLTNTAAALSPVTLAADEAAPASGPQLSLDALAAALLAAEEQAKALRAALLARMEASGEKRVAVAGGLVSYVAASTSSSVDSKAVAARMQSYAAQLRALGHDADDSLPLTVSERRASLRVSARSAA